MRIAVIGATGTVGSHVVTGLAGQGVDVVKVSRAEGVDLISGDGLNEALHGVDVAIDASNPFPPDDSVKLKDAFTASARHVVDSCSSEGVGHLVFLSIVGVENPVLQDFPYYDAKRAQEVIVADSGVPSTIVKSTQFHEFALNPAAVTVGDDGISVQDWLIQPIAAEVVADVMVQVALSEDRPPTRSVAGPASIRLPELTTGLLQRHDDPRPVRTVPAQLAALADGALLAPGDADTLGPSVADWLGSSSAHDTWKQSTGN